MYGNGYGANGGIYGANNPYMGRYGTYQYNKINGIDNNKYTQDSDTNENSHKKNKEKKRIQLKKNIDTFKDENEPDIKTKLANIKDSITGFFKKFKKSDLDDKAENPIYRFNAKDIEN